ncbi:MAG TPA: class F sortase [Candidatus Dormibacteraeota bacterium]|nr:class F sortase [Candidatus Dormibacteraeota bacterium]
MAITWPRLGRRLRAPAHLAGEAAVLVGVIGITLAFSSSDGSPNNGVVDPVAPVARFVPAPLVHFGWMGAALGKPVNVTYVPPVVVPTSPPATILITSINVHRPVEPVGVTSSGQMYQPKNLWDAGWYKYGPTPGAPGDAVIEGHAGYPNAPLLFARIGQLKSGDQIVIVLADGTHQTFLVQSNAVWRAGTSPPGLGEPYGPPMLTLITCTGPFDAQFKTYADRLVVEATYAGQS